MKNEDKTKEQLIELMKLRQRVAELEKSEIQRKQAEEVLRESEALYQSILENARDIIFTISSDFTITSLNPAFETITQWPREQWLGKNFPSLIHPDDLFLSLEIYQRILNKEMPPPSFESRIISESGDYIAIEFIITPQIRNGKVVSYLGIARDITGLKCAEGALQQCEEKYHNLIENIQDGVFLIQDDKIQFANEAFARMFGFTVEEVTGKDFREFVIPEDLEMVMNRYHGKQVGENITKECEFHALRRDGTGITVNVNIRLITYRGRAAFVGIVKDITERKRTEDLLQRSEEKYRTMIENSNEIIWTLDKQGNFTYFNKRAEEISDYELAEMQGKSFTSIITPADLSRAQEIFSEVLAGKSLQYIINAYRKDGSSITLSINTSPLFESGEIVGTISFSHDITERKLALERMQELYLSAIKAEIQKADEQQLELPAGHGESILVVYDEVEFRETTRAILEAYGYKVFTAKNGADAVLLYLQNREEIKVVLMDLMIPVMDGPAGIWVLRKINPEVKIIAVRGLTESDKFSGIAGAVRATLPKPYTAEKLLKTIHEVLSAK
jgi:PAS domain S-box-containing protein